MNPEFNAYKNIEEKTFLDFTPEIKECYNESFTFDKLLQSLNNYHDAVFPYQINYQILKHLPGKSKVCLQQIFYKILDSSHFLLSWSLAIIIPIPIRITADKKL